MTRELSWTAVPTADGSLTLRCPRTGALSHSLAGAWSEALERYAVPTRLAERARAATRLRLLDVGTGLGWNLAAALHVLAGSGCALDATGLELDPAPIEAALELAARGELAPAALLAHHAPVARALAEALSRPGQGVPLGPNGRLTLCLGDAREQLARLPPGARFDAVFLDPFAPADDPPLWSADFLTAVAARLAPGALLSTYSASLAVRARLARAGLRVGRGPRVGDKAEGTLASPDLAPPPLDPRTLRKLWRRIARGEAPTP